MCFLLCYSTNFRSGEPGPPQSWTDVFLHLFTRHNTNTETNTSLCLCLGGKQYYISREHTCTFPLQTLHNKTDDTHNTSLTQRDKKVNGRQNAIQRPYIILLVLHDSTKKNNFVALRCNVERQNKYVALRWNEFCRIENCTFRICPGTNNKSSFRPVAKEGNQYKFESNFPAHSTV